MLTISTENWKDEGGFNGNWSQVTAIYYFFLRLLSSFFIVVQIILIFVLSMVVVIVAYCPRVTRYRVVYCGNDSLWVFKAKFVEQKTPKDLIYMPVQNCSILSSAMKHYNGGEKKKDK
jgi:hypothetical protein